MKEDETNKKAVLRVDPRTIKTIDVRDSDERDGETGQTGPEDTPPGRDDDDRGTPPGRSHD